MSGLVRLRYWRYPRLVKAMENRHVDYNKTIRYIRKLEKAGEVYVICPSRELTIGRMEHNPQKLQKTYDLGRKDALGLMDGLLKWMKTP